MTEDRRETEIRRRFEAASFVGARRLAAGLAMDTGVSCRLRERERVDAKDAIGQRAALVRNGGSVVPDRASTTYAVAHQVHATGGTDPASPPGDDGSGR